MSCSACGIPYPTRKEAQGILLEDGKDVAQRDLGRELLALGFPQDGNWGVLCTKGSPRDTRYVVAGYRGETIIVREGDWARLFDSARGRVYAEYFLKE